MPEPPGRGLTRGRLHFLAALPRIDGAADAPTTSPTASRELVDTRRRALAGPRAPPVRMLPRRAARRRSCRRASQTGGAGSPIGIDEDTLAPVYLDFDADPHFLVFGDTECGKSNLLRLIADGHHRAVHPGPGPADLRRLPALAARRGRDAHLIGYAASSAAATAAASTTSRAALRRAAAAART